MDFNDSGWSQAWDHGTDTTNELILPSARKIWTEDVTNASYAYCRGHISKTYIVRSLTLYVHACM